MNFTMNEDEWLMGGNEFNLKYETSLSECDEEEQNVLNFNDLFPFNVIYPNDSKSDKDNDDDKVDIEHSSGDLSVIPLSNVINIDVGAYAHGTVDTAYSLIEYSVYDTVINTAYPELIRGGSEQSHVSIPSLRVCMCGLCRLPGILISIKIS
ncbi:hypothetical protein Tco_0524597 [Tanacetum coccineum]